MTIAHISDLHFGRIADSGVVEALVKEINETNVDLVAVSGDLTQRARPTEYAAAQTVLDALGPPTLVVAGNHDVYPWWRPLKRLRVPLERYKQFITDDLAPTFEANGVAALGLTSAYGPSIKGGRIGPADRAAMREFFSGMGDECIKVLVVHHQLHPAAIGPISPHPVARQAQQTLAVAGEVGVDLVLCGHLHISAIQPFETIPGTPRIVVASAGTATSNRWREPMGSINVYNVVSVGPDAFSIEERRYVPEEGRFVHDSVTRFDHTE
ncbi:metallophosphoesterase family protein [Salinibacter altiplanensis]|uniref:metallophosphoesterase family protein n=1 Tax=Salinibacter altiplanensis TaxID=1803181 RepID=UPI000C9FC3D2|nr:metallophosphoesterase family protein [Salinibacter altiplanensis]